MLEFYTPRLAAPRLWCWCWCWCWWWQQVLLISRASCLLTLTSEYSTRRLVSPKMSDIEEMCPVANTTVSHSVTSKQNFTSLTHSSSALNDALTQSSDVVSSSISFAHTSSAQVTVREIILVDTLIACTTITWQATRPAATESAC